MLAFDDVAPLGAAKIGILGGSLLAGIIATVILKTIGRSASEKKAQITR